MRMTSRITTAIVASVAGLGVLASACGRKTDSTPAVATPSVTLSHDRVPLGSPIDITYKFVVASDAKFDEDYYVMVHVMDADNQMIFDFDHSPAVPTRQWKPGQTVEYTRTEFMPIFPYVGEATLQVGLYSPASKKRLTLTGENNGQHAYKVSKFQIQPQTENILLFYKDGWNPGEQAEHNPAVEWQWTKKNATLAFKNPRKDAVFYLDVDAAGGVFQEPQTVKVTLGNATADEFPLQPKQRELRRIKLTAAQLGKDDMAELHIVVDKSFVPAQLPGNNKDPRELGVRVFHAFVDAR
jgi:hypothetical protein